LAGFWELKERENKVQISKSVKIEKRKKKKRKKKNELIIERPLPAST